MIFGARTIQRCPQCAMPVLPGDKALWCRVQFCGRTAQRSPTEQQVRNFRINEPFKVPLR